MTIIFIIWPLLPHPMVEHKKNDDYDYNNNKIGKWSIENGDGRNQKKKMISFKVVAILFLKQFFSSTLNDNDHKQLRVILMIFVFDSRNNNHKAEDHSVCQLFLFLVQGFNYIWKKMIVFLLGCWKDMIFDNNNNILIIIFVFFVDWWYIFQCFPKYNDNDDDDHNEESSFSSSSYVTHLDLVA